MDRQTSVVARRFARALTKHLHTELLILFGSRARGDHFVTSDFDFVLVSKDFIGKPFSRRASPFYMFWRSPQELDLLCYTPEEWHRLKNERGILLNAQRDGVRLL